MVHVIIAFFGPPPAPPCFPLFAWYEKPKYEKQKEKKKLKNSHSAALHPSPLYLRGSAPVKLYQLLYESTVGFAPDIQTHACYVLACDKYCPRISSSRTRLLGCLPLAVLTATGIVIGSIHDPR